MGLLQVRNAKPQREQAMAAIERLLTLQADHGLLADPPRLLAERMISRAWAQKSALLDGTAGEAPHKLAIAAVALAVGVQHATEDGDGALQGNYLLALGHILDEAAQPESREHFHETDLSLLDLAAAAFTLCPAGLKDATQLD